MYCAEMYTTEYRVGSNHECFYNPYNLAQFVWEKGYTFWKWLLTAIPMASILGLLCVFSNQWFVLNERGHLLSYGTDPNP